MRELAFDELAQMNRSAAELAIRERTSTVYLGSQQVLTRILGHQKIYLSTKDTGFAGHVMLDGFWEMWLTLFMARHLKAGMHVIDVGANFGYYTLLFGSGVGPTGRVLAVEPVPETAALLERSVSLNGHSSYTTIERVALGAIPNAKTTIFVPEGEPKNARVTAAGTRGGIVVPATTLDTLISDWPRVDLVKIDAEGAEVEILQGMSRVIDKYHPAVILEFNASRCADPSGFLRTLHDGFRKLHQLDYTGKLSNVTDDALLTENTTEDRLLFLEAS